MMFMNKNKNNKIKEKKIIRIKRIIGIRINM